MHLLVRETRSLDDDQPAVDLGHAPADIVLLSFSDADLAAAAAAWPAATDASLRLVNLARLRHPMSVDLYVEQVIARSRCVVLRLLGGLDYWPYGAQECAAACRAEAIPLLIVPGDVRDDARLRELSTVSAENVAAMDGYFRHGGPHNIANALRLAAHLAGRGALPAVQPRELPSAGLYDCASGDGRSGRASIVFYRSHLLSADTAPVDALASALAARGMAVRAVHVSSLKDPQAAAFVAEHLAAWRPCVVLNATGFSASNGAVSPLDAAGVPVLQAVLAVGGRETWAASARGLSQTDLAMQVVLPELDGRLLTTAISFKAAAEPTPGLDFVRTINRPDPDGIALAADRALGWARLAAKPPERRRIGIVLSDYPGAGGGQVGHAVGLDTFASLSGILTALRAGGYRCDDGPDLRQRLTQAEPVAILTVEEYRTGFATLPASLRDAISAAWGAPEDDSTFKNGAFRARVAVAPPPLAGLGRAADQGWGEGDAAGLDSTAAPPSPNPLPQGEGAIVCAIQPDRGHTLDRKSGYHDPDLPPCHGYVAFHLWLRDRIDALVQLGAHGTLEWLPGKAVALSTACAPAALLGGLPVIYPFIVNNPGEAAAAKRRLGAVTIGHLTPPLRAAGAHGAAAELERLIDEYAAADGLDRRRTALLRRDILVRATETGLLAESGVPPDAPEDEALARLDAWLCDVKELQIRDGLHVFGQPPAPGRRAALLATLPQAEDALDRSAPAEMAALLAALDGRFVAPGPSGAPSRGRVDVLPTGRNLFAIDPRAAPTRSALALAERAAAELLRRHLQDHGDWPRSLVIDLWGSATMRTGGEDFALALILLGARPVWDDGARVTGIEILPLALLDRPRVDVTLRISGLFRDAFAGQIALFDAAVRAVAARDEAADFNPLAAAARGLAGAALRRATTRIFGAAPGDYGAAVLPLLERGAWQARAELGQSYLAASGHAYGHGLDGVADADSFAERVASAAGFVHTQDHAETDLLDSPDYAAHEGGFAAAAEALGASPALYHLDTSRPDAPRPRALAEEIARVVRGRAANPAWIAGMMPHGYRGAAEIARGVAALHAFAATLPHRLDRQFELLFDATLGAPEVDRFLIEANPQARAAMAAAFRDALARDLWRCRRNTVAEALA